jgi:hypothetical protein
MHVSRPFDDLADYWADDLSSEDELSWADDPAGLGEVLRGALVDSYAGSSDEAMEDALEAVFDAMSPAESFSFSNALKQIQRGAGQALTDPTVNQLLRTAAPIAGGALGTVIGGPVGTALGSKLGTVAVNALPGPAPRTTVVPPATMAVQPNMAGPPSVAGLAAGAMSALAPAGVGRAVSAIAPAVAGGSAAAAQGLVLSQRPDVLQALLSLAMGQHGQKSVSGVPVAGVMNMLSSVFGQAAADADELLYLDGEDGESADGEDLVGITALPSDRTLYTALLDADNYELSEALS